MDLLASTRLLTFRSLDVGHPNEYPIRRYIHVAHVNEGRSCVLVTVHKAARVPNQWSEEGNPA